jgi:hypothetical protein
MADFVITIRSLTAELAAGTLHAMVANRVRRQRGTIRPRGQSFQVTVYAGLDPLPGKRMFLSESTSQPSTTAASRFARLVCDALIWRASLRDASVRPPDRRLAGLAAGGQL